MKRICEADHLYDILLNSDNLGELFRAVKLLHHFYADHCGISAGDTGSNNILLPSGKAISVASAAHCLLEQTRTSRFVRGIYRAVKRLKSDFPGERIRILYAGSGPYAALVTPLTACFEPHDVSFDILDINEESLGSVKRLYTELRLLAYVNQFIQADAAEYHIPKENIPHLIISETMNAALKNEPQVQIMMNLVPQLPPGGIFIPQKIDVNACLLDPSQEYAALIAGGKCAVRMPLETIFSISKENLTTHSPVNVLLPALTTHRELNLLTDITIFEEEKLSINECSLTLPQRVRLPGDLSNKSITFRYIMSENPHFDYKVIDEDLQPA